jgi:arginine/lysine/ornithine decarboxylase
MGERLLDEATRFARALRIAAERVGPEDPDADLSFAAAPPWGELAMTPREAFLGAQQVLPADDAVGRIAAESLATYPPGIPNVLPGERLTAETLAYIRETLKLGGSVRGASDRLLHTVRVVAE